MKNIFVTVSRSEVSGYFHYTHGMKSVRFWSFSGPYFPAFGPGKIRIRAPEYIPLQWNRSSHRRCSVKKDVLKDFVNFTGKYLCWGLFLIKACNFLKKETPTQGLSCEIYEIFENTYFEEHLQMEALSEVLLHAIKSTQVYSFALYTYVCASGGKKCSSFGKFDVLCFLETAVLRLFQFF